jgi:hypothetical protein
MRNRETGLAEKRDKACRLLKKLQMQGRREEETGAYWLVREDFPTTENAADGLFQQPATPRRSGQGALEPFPETACPTP